MIYWRLSSGECRLSILYVTARIVKAVSNGGRYPKGMYTAVYTTGGCNSWSEKINSVKGQVSYSRS